MSSSPPDRLAVRHGFERAASQYDGASALQQEIADRLLARLDIVLRRPASILDLGSGTGYCSAALQKRYPDAVVVRLDLAVAMLKARRGGGTLSSVLGALSPGRWFGAGRAEAAVCADGERLPFPADRFDLVLSNLMLQWCDAPRVFAEARRVLRPGGLFLFTSFGPDTLRELREAFRAADDRPHVHEFVDMHVLGDALLQQGFVDPVMDVDRLVWRYPDVGSVLAGIRSIGARYAGPGRSRGLMGPRSWRRFVAAYEARRDAEGVPATWEVVYGHAIGP